jgi:hypothetical protein
MTVFGSVMHSLGILIVTLIVLWVIGSAAHHGATGGYAVGYGIQATIGFVGQVFSTV